MTEQEQPKSRIVVDTNPRSAEKKGHAPDGVWVTYEAIEGGGFKNVVIHTAEINALRIAVANNQRAVKVQFGTSLEQAAARPPIAPPITR